MRLAIQETLLPGDTALEKLQTARALGFEGVEFTAQGMDARIMEVAAALDATGLAVSALNLGGTHLLHPDFDTRDAAIAGIRQAMADSLDLDCGTVIMHAHRPDTPRLPDLRPLRDSLELERELLAKQLRATLGDLAYAMGASLHLATLNRYESHLLNRLEQLDLILDANDYHPHLKMAAKLFHMALEESDPYAALKQHVPHIGTVHLADHHGGLPGTGWLDFGRITETLKAGGYSGWLTVASVQPETGAEGLPECVAMLRGCMQK